MLIHGKQVSTAAPTPLTCDERGGLQVRKGAKTTRSEGGGSEFQALDAPAKLIEFFYQNFATTEMNLQVHDAAAAPADGAAPLLNIPLPAAVAGAPVWGIIAWEEVCANGIYFCVSDDPDQKTLNAGGSVQLFVRYDDTKNA